METTIYESQMHRLSKDVALPVPSSLEPKMYAMHISYWLGFD